MRFVVAVACLVVACGRGRFDPLDRPGDGGQPALVRPFVSHAGVSSSVDTFVAQAHTAGNAILLHVGCDSSTVQTSVAVSAPNWTVMPIGPFITTGPKAAQSFAAVAPDTMPATFTVTWSTVCSDQEELGDEIAGPVTFDSHDGVSGTGTCTTSVNTARANALVWAGCSSAGTLLSVSTGYTKSVDDGRDDWTAFRATADPAGSTEVVSFSNTNARCIVTTVSVSAP